MRFANFLPTGETLLGVSPAGPTARVPPSGLNPSTVAEDVGRLQALQEEKEARAHAEAARACRSIDFFAHMILIRYMATEFIHQRVGRLQ